MRRDSCSVSRTSLTSHVDCELRTSLASNYDELPTNDLKSSIRPFYILFQLLGMWPPSVSGDSPTSLQDITYQAYHYFILLLWLASLVAVMSIDFVHYGFKTIRLPDILNSASNCVLLLSPFVFTQFYLKRGQFVDLVRSVQNISPTYRSRVRRSSRGFAAVSIVLWIFEGTFFSLHWIPFFSEVWHYIVYIIVITYSTGWWAVWLSIYAFVCDVHRLQINSLINCIRCRDTSSVHVLHRLQQLRNSLEKTQQDFNVIISFSVGCHALDVIIFSFAYFDHAFGKDYQLWQYAGGIVFDLITILIKLFPPALVAAAVHRVVIEAGKRCDVSPGTENMPIDDMALFQYMANCEEDMGLKILGIRITVQLAGTILMTIITAGVSFVAFVVPRLIRKTHS